jgi:uncharacterized protein (DUF1684 family)
MSRKECSFLFTSCLCLLLLGATPNLSVSKGEGDPMEGREEKLKAFREKRDQFFKGDALSPLKEVDRKNFRGLLYYPIHLRYAMIGSIERYPIEPKPIYVDLPTNKKKDKKYVKYGRFRFKWEEREYGLQIYRPLGGGELFLPFKDKTSGVDTYAGGRYLPIEPMPRGSGSTRTEKVLIDFNRAYHPFCVYSEKYTCPFAPKENWLDLPIQAGEKGLR